MLVRESILFQKKRDPKEALGLGDYHRVAENKFPGKKIIYFSPTDQYEDNGTLEYKGEKFNTKDINGETIFKLMKRSDILVYVKDDKALGWKNSKSVAQYKKSLGKTYKLLKDYSHLKIKYNLI